MSFTVCTDACPATCRHCRPVNYDRMRREREARRRRENGGPGRPPWWVGCEMDPDARLSGRVMY